MSEPAWKKYSNDFDAMSDVQIEVETRQAEQDLENAENWLEAVASWKAAGQPRSKAIAKAEGK
jgi:hypothetical protein